MPNIYGQFSWLRFEWMKSAVGHVSSLLEEPILYGWCSMAGYHKAFQMMSLPSSSTSTMKHIIQLQQEQASRHMHSSMRMINLRFQQNKEVLSSNTIMAVAILVIVASFSGESHACRAHHDGLIKLIELRGGIDTFHRVDSLHLSRYVFSIFTITWSDMEIDNLYRRIDSNASWTEGRRPRLPMYSSSVQFSHQYAKMLSLSSRLRTFLPDSLFRVACDLQAMSDILDENPIDGTTNRTLSQEDVHCFEDRFAATQHDLVDFPFSQTGIDNTVRYHQQNCWRNAAFIYLNNAIRGTPGKGLIDLATGRLIDSLLKSDLRTGWTAHRDVLLWVLFISWNGAFGHAEKSLFAIQFQRLVSDMGLSSFEQIRQVLRQHVWRDSYLGQPLREAWISAT